MPDIDTNTRGEGPRWGGAIRGKVKTKFVNSALAAAVAVGSIGGITYTNYDDVAQDPEIGYVDNLEMIRSQNIRNTLHDNSDYRDVKQSELVLTDHYGPRSDYVDANQNPSMTNGLGNGETHAPTVNGGQFRTQCEFSHFAYDDPILYPDQPGAAHLHMFFGNTDVNAFTTQETLKDSGSSTCNGQELNRTGYWSPAMFDGDGNVRIPERVMVYYKGEGFANSGNQPFYNNGTPNPGAQVYELGMRMIANSNPAGISVPELSAPEGGEGSQVNYKCSDNFSSNNFTQTVQNIPNCDGNQTACNSNADPAIAATQYPNCRSVLEMEIKFWNCHTTYDETNPNDPNNPDLTDWLNWRPASDNPGGGHYSRGGWFYSNCAGHGGSLNYPASADDKEIYPHLTYFVNYVIEPGETTEDWYLASDVDVSTLNNANPSLVAGGAGSTTHADWWGSWHPEVNQMFIDNCVNFSANPIRSGCATGYLTDGGPDSLNPLPGPALKLRPQYDTPGQTSSYKIDAQTIFNELCVPLGPAHSYTNERHAAYCKP